jgi:hypothetical protein
MASPGEQRVDLLLVAAAIGIPVGYLLGGHLRYLLGLRLRWLWLPWIAVYVSLLPWLPGVPHALEPALLLAAGALVSAFFAINIGGCRGWLRVGIAVVALGWGLNGAVIVANGGMPVDAVILAHTPTHLDRTLDLHRFEHTVLSPSTRLRWLADIIPWPCLHRLWRNDHREVCGGVSVGDLLLVGGLATSLTAAMLGAPRRDPGAQQAARTGEANGAR